MKQNRQSKAGVDTVFSAMAVFVIALSCLDDCVRTGICLYESEHGIKQHRLLSAAKPKS
jgi:hypothetical protein